MPAAFNPHPMSRASATLHIAERFATGVVHAKWYVHWLVMFRNPSAEQSHLPANGFRTSRVIVDLVERRDPANSAGGREVIPHLPTSFTSCSFTFLRLVRSACNPAVLTEANPRPRPIKESRKLNQRASRGETHCREITIRV